MGRVSLTKGGWMRASGGTLRLSLTLQAFFSQAIGGQYDYRASLKIHALTPFASETSCYGIGDEF